MRKRPKTTGVEIGNGRVGVFGTKFQTISLFAHRFVALELLKNANIAAGMVLPGCQDTGTAIIMGELQENVLNFSYTTHTPDFCSGIDYVCCKRDEKKECGYPWIWAPWHIFSP